jgi:hypothetical protein
MKAILIGGAAVLAAGAVALAFTQDRRETPPQAPEVAQHEATPPPVAELADPGTIPVEEPKAAEVVVDTGVQVDPDGFVWEPLSFDHPQIKNNGDGTVTMKKLARIVEAGGKVREVPITVNAAPQQRRLPIRSRGTPAPKQEPTAGDTATTDQDGE